VHTDHNLKIDICYILHLESFKTVIGDIHSFYVGKRFNDVREFFILILTASHIISNYLYTHIRIHARTRARLKSYKRIF
jgi:hypothetical protein